MNFQDDLEKVRDLYIVLSFISVREIALYFLVHYKNMEHTFFFIFLFFFYSFIHYDTPYNGSSSYSKTMVYSELKQRKMKIE